MSPQYSQEPAKDEMELYGLRASAKVKLKEVLEHRTKVPEPEKKKCEVQKYPYKEAVTYPAWYSDFKRETDLLQSDMDDLLDEALTKMKQYEAHANRRYPCQAFNDLIARFNSPVRNPYHAYDSDYYHQHPKYGQFQKHTHYCFYQDGTVSDSRKMFVDPGIFWTTELKFKPRPKEK